MQLLGGDPDRGDSDGGNPPSEVCSLFLIYPRDAEWTIRASSILVRFTRLPSFIFHPLDVFYTYTCEFPGDYTCEINILGSQSAHTFESMFSQIISASPTRPLAARQASNTPPVINPVPANGGSFLFVNCFV